MEVKSGTASGLGAGLGLLRLCPGALGLPPGKLDLLSPGGRGCSRHVNADPSLALAAHMCAGVG